MPNQTFIDNIKRNAAFIGWADFTVQELSNINNAQLLDIYLEWLLSLRSNQVLGSVYGDEHALDLLAACADLALPFKEDKKIVLQITAKNINEHLVVLNEWLNQQYEQTLDNFVDCQYQHTRALFRPEDRQHLKAEYIEFNQQLRDKVNQQKDLLFSSYRQNQEGVEALSQRKKELRQEGLKVLFDKDKDNFLTRRMGYSTFYELTRLKLFSTDFGPKWNQLNLYWLKLTQYETEKKELPEKLKSSKEDYQKFLEKIIGTKWERFRQIKSESTKKLDDLNRRRIELLNEMLKHGTKLSKQLDAWEKEISDLAIAHTELLSDNGPIFLLESELDSLKNQINQGGVTPNVLKDLKAELSYWRRVRLQYTSEQEKLATQLVLLEQLIPLNAEFLLGEISSQYDLSMQHKMAKQQMELIRKIPKLPKAMNIYCTCFNFSFDLVLEIGRLVTDLGKTSYEDGDWVPKKKSTAVVGWLVKSGIGVHIPVVDDVLSKVGKPREVHKLTTQDTTGNLTIQFSVGLYFGYGATEEISLKAGVCLVYTAILSHDNKRNFIVSSTMELKGKGSAQFTRYCDVKIGLGLFKDQTVFKFNDVFQWAAWFCHKWARLAALYTAWCNIVDPSTLESDRFGTMSEDEKVFLLSAAQQIFTDNQKVKRTIEIVSELLTEEPHIIKTEAFNVLTDLSIDAGFSAPSPLKKEKDGSTGTMKVVGLSLKTGLIPEKKTLYTYHYKMVKNYRMAVEYKKDEYSFMASGQIAILGWSLYALFENNLTTKQKSLTINIDLDGLLKGDPFGVGQRLGELIGKIPPEVLWVAPAAMGVTFLACIGADKVMEKLNKKNDKVAVIGGVALAGGVGSATVLSIAKPGDAIGDMQWASAPTETGVNLVQSLLETIIVIVLSKALNSKAEDWTHHLFGFPEASQDNIAIPLGLWQCQLVQSKLDFSKLSGLENPSEVMYPTQWVLAYWRKYAQNSLAFSKGFEIPIPTPAGEFFVYIDLAVSLLLERFFAERLEHNTFSYVLRIYQGLINRHNDKHQRPKAASGEALWKEFCENNKRNLFLMCLYTGCRDLGYRTKSGKKYGPRIYYEVLIDSKYLKEALTFLKTCISLYDSCFKNADSKLIARFQQKHISINEVKKWISSNEGLFDVCLKAMADYFACKNKALSAEDQLEWKETSKYDEPFHFTSNPVTLIKRTYRYVCSRGDRKLHDLGETIQPHANQNILVGAMSFAMLMDQLQKLDPKLMKKSGLGSKPMKRKQIEKLVKKHGDVEKARLIIETQIKGPEDLQNAIKKIITDILQKPMTPQEAMAYCGGQVEIRIEKRTMKKDLKHILGNYFDGRKTSGVWNKDEFLQNSDMGDYARRYDMLKNIDKTLDDYHSLAWQINNFNERIKALSEIIVRINTLLTLRRTTKRKKALFELAEQVAVEIGLFEKAKTLVVKRPRGDAIINKPKKLRRGAIINKPDLK